MKRSQTLQDATVASLEKKHQARSEALYIGPLPGREIEVSRSAGPGAPEPATAAASSLRRTASKADTAAEPRPTWSLIACAPMAHHHRGRRQRFSRPARQPRHSRFHFLRLRADASAAGPRRRVPAVSLRASLSRSYAGKLDCRRSRRHQRRHRHLASRPSRRFHSVMRWMLVLEDSDEDRPIWAKGLHAADQARPREEGS